MHQHMHEVAFDDNDELSAGVPNELIRYPFTGDFGIVTSIQVACSSLADPVRVTVFFAGFMVFPPSYMQDSSFIVHPFWPVFNSEIEVLIRVYSEIDDEYSLLVTFNFLIGEPFFHKLPGRDPFVLAKSRQKSPLLTIRKGNLKGKKLIPWWDARTKDVVVVPVVFDSSSTYHQPQIGHYWISDIIPYYFTIVHVRIWGSHIPLNLFRASQNFMGWVVRPGDPGYDGQPILNPGGIPFWYYEKTGKDYRVAVPTSYFYHRIWLNMREKNSRIVLRSTPNLGAGVPPDPFETWIVMITLFKDFPAPRKGIRSGILAAE